ncbi:hypothetical protein [Bradyrhizobium sp. B120]|uniref:hypothetical protein n=1 Tax=Bradyrhizobium sp. B120 TaxID=3410088 RepID=UPI003B987C71
MTQSLKLGGAPKEAEGKGIRRLNRLQIIVAIVPVIVFFAVIFYGLTSRGLYFRRAAGIDTASSNPASTHADQLKKGSPPASSAINKKHRHSSRHRRRPTHQAGEHPFPAVRRPKGGPADSSSRKSYGGAPRTGGLRAVPA